ncbi:MAG TPA: glycosyltransferase family A protein [Usitatibacter sp.]|jgi:glycosyltransferase involved in cell wall biosynthesis|nr:glycosyltransferase family A protein [Usitatibacter sp.]
MSTLVSVVVPTYRRPEMLERCLEALVAQRFPAESFEIVVADDGPDERTRRLVREWALRTRGAPEIRYVPVTTTQGPAGARNRGWEAADSPIIAFTDDDTLPQPDWLVEGYRVILASPRFLAATGRVVVPLPKDRAPTDYERDLARLGTAEFVTANCFVRRSALEAIGGFDERFTSAWREDSDLQFTLMRSLPGEIVKAPRAVVEHPVRAMTWRDNLRAHRKILFDALLFKKHPELYRARIRRSPPWNYYVVVAAIVGMTAAALTGTDLGFAACFAVWLVLTTRFALKRLEGTSSARDHVVDIVLGSIAIPPVAVFWRLMGALRFRVLFL